MHNTKRVIPELNSGSMAVIAFLLLTFFLMTTVIDDHKGLVSMLPPFLNQPIEQPVHDRNLFTININVNDRILAEGKEVESFEFIKKI